MRWKAWYHHVATPPTHYKQVPIVSSRSFETLDMLCDNREIVIIFKTDAPLNLLIPQAFLKLARYLYNSGWHSYPSWCADTVGNICHKPPLLGHSLRHSGYTLSSTFTETVRSIHQEGHEQPTFRPGGVSWQQDPLLKLYVSSTNKVISSPDLGLECFRGSQILY